jgi:hypothetical protein
MQGVRGAIVAALAAAVLAAVLLAGCGGGSSSGGGAHVSSFVNTAIAYSHCMRSHGVPDFPDPNGQGDFRIQPMGRGSDLDPNAPAYQAALAKCGPTPSTVTAAQENQAFEKVLKAAACMRANGVPNYPEPTLVKGAEGGIDLNYNGINPDAPVVQAAAKKCGYGNAQQLLESGAGP